jgi:alpha-acetolactate decarboxylase
MAPVSHLYQYSTASALMAGVAATGIQLSELLTHGNYGLGTMTKIDGEVVIIDGTAYHLQSSGSVQIVENQKQLPFAMVTDLATTDESNRSVVVEGLRTKQSIYDNLIKLSPGVTNRFVFFIIEGRFDRMKVRVVRGQQYPGQPLSELGDQQRVISHEDVQGQVVGFWSPEFMDGVSVSGLHAHFLSSDKTFGGHVLELEAKEIVAVTAKLLNGFHLELPDNEEFGEAKLAPGGEALHKVEG